MARGSTIPGERGVAAVATAGKVFDNLVPIEHYSLVR
jgi:hypothetical protein